MSEASNDKILFFGSTGTTGREVARQLVDRGYTPRLVVRDRAKSAAFDGKAVFIKGDLNSDSVLARAVEGIEKLYLVSGTNVDSVGLEKRVIDASKRAGVTHVVKLSVITADKPRIALARWHADSEQYLRDSGLAWTMLRPTNFHTSALLMWAATIKSSGVFYQPTAHGRWASVDPDDIGAVAVEALTFPGHRGKAYTLTGPNLLDAYGYAEELTAALGKPITFVDVPLAAAHEGMLAAGIPEAYAEAAMEMLATMRADEWTDTASDVEAVLGRKPTSMRAWAARNAAAFT